MGMAEGALAIDGIPNLSEEEEEDDQGGEESSRPAEEDWGQMVHCL